MGGVAHQRRAQLLAGTVTFLAAKLDGVDPANGVDGPGARCPEPVRAVIAAHQGVLVTDANGGGGSDDGDQTLAVFASAIQATTAALDLQRQQVDPGRCDGPRPCPRLRIGMHTGESRTQGDHLGKGAAVQLATRLCDAAHPGRTLLSMVTATLAADALPGGAWLVDQGAHRLRDLARPERVFELRHADLAGDFPPLGTLDGLATNLPVQLTSFVGRSEELATVEDLLGRERLVTLTGSGGCGKTRLAARAATEVADRWPDGVWWADLGPLTDAARVAELVASTVRVMV